MIEWLKQFFTKSVDDRLYEDAVRADAIEAGICGEELELHVEEALALRKLIEETRPRSSEEE